MDDSEDIAKFYKDIIKKIPGQSALPGRSKQILTTESVRYTIERPPIHLLPLKLFRE